MQNHAELPIRGRETKPSPIVEDVLQFIAVAKQETRDMRTTMEQDRETQATEDYSRSIIEKMQEWPEYRENEIKELPQNCIHFSHRP